MTEGRAWGGAERRSGPRRILRGEDAWTLIETQLAEHGGGILSVLSQYQLTDTVRTWHGSLRALEEFFNVPLFGIDDEHLVAWLLTVPLDDRFLRNPGPLLYQVQTALSPNLDDGTVSAFAK